MLRLNRLDKYKKALAHWLTARNEDRSCPCWARAIRVSATARSEDAHACWRYTMLRSSKSGGSDIASALGLLFAMSVKSFGSCPRTPDIGGTPLWHSNVLCAMHASWRSAMMLTLCPASVRSANALIMVPLSTSMCFSTAPVNECLPG